MEEGSQRRWKGPGKAGTEDVKPGEGKDNKKEGEKSWHEEQSEVRTREKGEKNGGKETQEVAAVF